MLWSTLAFAAPPTSPVLSDPVFAEIAAGKRSLGPKDHGPAVEAVQAVLTLWNYCVTTPCLTGTFDDATATAVRSFTAEWAIEPADAKLDAAELAMMDGRLNAAVYAPIRAAGLRGVRYDVPVSAGMSADDVRLALIRVAVLRADPPAVLAAHREALQSVGAPGPGPVLQVWLPVGAAHELLQ